ncbi:hypothetical protein [Pyxidicoccus xibeiensis]|uniref:hypothetical protein n=1 Tax=Pyxidicoccus xibeiensis TaxID=2906759 RepID=UPI0020A7F964|nr:hypothetical protein [Pyxidicoccus xibeiensis]MCP3138367.1 hypothetical protein [Pyxidicoccus xibeiensis]
MVLLLAGLRPLAFATRTFSRWETGCCSTPPSLVARGWMESFESSVKSLAAEPGAVA